MSISDKMMKIAGRTKEGIARALRVNNDGLVEVVDGNKVNIIRLLPVLSVEANSTQKIEVSVSEMVTTTLSRSNFKEFELSWCSGDKLGGEGTSCTIYHHRDIGDLGYNSLTFERKLILNEGIYEERYCYIIDDKKAQTLRNRYITIEFKNDTDVKKSLYSPYLVLK